MAMGSVVRQLHHRTAAYRQTQIGRGCLALTQPARRDPGTVPAPDYKRAAVLGCSMRDILCKAVSMFMRRTTLSYQTVVCRAHEIAKRRHAVF
jgi:hypothetical protein